jgi:hypothetical protein
MLIHLECIFPFWYVTARRIWQPLVGLQSLKISLNRSLNDGRTFELSGHGPHDVGAAKVADEDAGQHGDVDLHGHEDTFMFRHVEIRQNIIFKK